MVVPPAYLMTPPSRRETCLGSPPPRRALANARTVLFFALANIGVSATAQAASDIPPAPRVIKSIQEFYDLPGAEAARPHNYSWDLDILYADPDWNLLWVENHGVGTFIDLNRELPPLAAGQHIHAEGELIPAHRLSLQGATITTHPADAPVVPLPTAGRLADSGRFNNRLVVVEAVVDRQSEPDSAHLMLEASAEGLHLIIRLRIDPAAERPKLEGAIIRATGVYVEHRAFSGDLASIALWVPDLGAIEVRGSLRDDPQFAEPVVRIDRITDGDGTRRIHVVGTVHAFDNTAATVTLRDATGQIVVATAQAREVRLGAELEATGLPEVAGVRRFLRDARIRPLETRPPEAPDTTLRLADQVLALKSDDADRALPVQLFGVATWMDPASGSMFVQDVAGGIEIRLPPHAEPSPPLPCAVRIEGRTARGSFAPVVAASAIVWSNPLGAPEPRMVSLEEMLTGNAHGRWVGVRALLRGVRREQGSTQLDLTTTTGELVAWLPQEDVVDARPGSLVAVQGVCCAIANERRQLANVRLLVPSARFVAVEQEAPADPFALPARSIAGLREFGPADSALRRVCTLGTVIHHEPGRYLCLQEGNETLLVLARTTAPLTPGDRVEVVGLPGREGTRLVLREALCRRTGHGAEPPPLDLPHPEDLGNGLDGRLVRLTGAVTGIQDLPTETVVTVQAGKRRFPAAIARGSFDAERCPIGGIVTLRGVYRAIYDEYRQPIDFTLRLRTIDDIAVVRPPPLWTVPRALAAAGSLLLLTAAVLGWLAVLRSRVAKQTRQIRTQLEHQQRLEAELQQAHRLESLALLTGGIAHDFNNLLTGILANISFARLDERAVEAVGDSLADAELATLRARDLTQSLLVFARGGSPARAVLDLSALVREAARFALLGSNVRGEFVLPSGLWPADVDPVQISQVVQNLAINAVQAMPAGGTLHLALANERIAAGAKASLQPGRYLRLETTDTGTGIPPELVPKIFDPYFTTKKTGNGLGLATVFAIVRRHGGHIEVDSVPGRGTTFRLWLPAAERAPQSDAPRPTPAPRDVLPAPAEATRILVMDDDAAVRRIAALALLHAGYEVTPAADGREAVALFELAQRSPRPFRLVLLDLAVPGAMNGEEAVGAIRQLAPAIRAIASTGNVNSPHFLAHREHGFDAALAKPYEVKQLVALVATTLAAPPAP